MSARYPDEIKTFIPKQDYVDDVEASHINDLQDEITAIQQELGVNPKGDAETVKDRLEKVESEVYSPLLQEIETCDNIISLPENTTKGQVSIVVKGYTGVLDMTWKQIQGLVRRGKHIDIFTIGDQFVANYNGVEYIWDVIGINHDIPADKNYINSLTLQAHDCLRNCQWDAPEALYYAATALAPSKHIFEIDGGKYEFTTTLEVPEGGQVYVYSWDDDYIPLKARTYAADRVTVIEDDITVSTSTDSPTLSPVNHQTRCRYGSNNYWESNIRDWLNSEADQYIWTPKTNFDRPSTGAPYTGPGFLKLLDPELAAVIGKVNKQVARNTLTDGGGQDLFSDKVFLLSRVEAGGGTEGTTDGEEVYSYYDGIENAGRIKLLNGSPRGWWLRSPHVSTARYARYVRTSGVVTGSYASSSGGLAPACCII